MVKADRNKKIDIKQQVTTQDSYGEANNSYTTIYSSIWASVSPLVGREYFSAEQVHSEVSYRVVIEYMTGIYPKMVVFYDSRKLEIVSVIDYKEQHRELSLMCKELV